MREVEDMTLREYLFRMKAHTLSHVDKERDIHLSAWLNVQASSTVQKGKKTEPKFKSFKDFFDYEERERSILGDARKSNLTDRQRKLAKLASQLNS